MGYCSDVGLCLTATGKHVLETALVDAAKNNPHISEIRGLLEKAEVRTDADSGSVGYLWRTVQWYIDYVDVSFIENLLPNMESSDYLFIRISEADDDTEYCGGFWENPLGMCLVRGIVFD